MRREEYERTYGRRSHMPPPMPSPQEDPRSRRSRTKMKCLISIGLILPALAAVIGVAAWAVSADVVMNSGSNRGNKPDNSMMQNFAAESDNRRDIFRANEENERFRYQTQSSTRSTTQSTTATPTTTQSTTTSKTPAPATLSPQEETDVNAILSKLISASGAATGGSGPRFVVVAPLPDNSEINSSPNSSPIISRADSSSPTKAHPREDTWHVSGSIRSDPDLMSSSSLDNFQRVQATMGRSASQRNATNRIGLSSSEVSNRRIGQKPYIISASGNGHGSNAFNNPQIDITGFEPFDSMMHDLQASQTAQNIHQNQPPNFQSHGSFNPKRGPPQGHYNNRNHHKPLPMQQFDPNEQHIFHHHIPDHNLHGLKSSQSHPQGMMAPPLGVGLKPIQQQLHHIDPLRPEESNRWGTVGFHGPPSGGYVHKPPEGISLSISSPANSGTHVSAEPVSVIKSFFLPFLPKPRLNMNARVVFGVVLDKGMGLGGDKKSAGHRSYH